MSKVQAFEGVGARVWLATLFGALAIATAAPGHAATSYLSDALTDVPPAGRAIVANPQPVQLIFQFETKGAPNARATKYLKQHVIDDLKATGAFSQISDAPTANGAILSVTIDNADTPQDIQNAARQGFATGLTFGLAGSTVVDHYQAKLEYVAGPTATRVAGTAVQTIITQLGLNNTAPEHAVKVGKVDDAVFEMVRQVIDNSMNEIVKDPAFNVAPQAAPAASPPAPAATPPSSNAATTSPPTTPSSSTPARP